MRFSTATVSLVLSLLVSAVASAQVCVEVAVEQDNLSESDRAAALLLLRQTFEDQAYEVVIDGCTATYRVSHVQLGGSITVTLAGPEGQRRATAAGLEELRPVYDQLVRALRDGVEVGTGTATRDSVTEAQDAPRRVQTDNMFYLRLGGGAIFGAGVGGGPSFGLGWRYELDHVGIDASVINLLIDQGKDNETGDGGLNGSWVRIAVLYFLEGIGQSSPYFGGGLSWGGVFVCGDRVGGAVYYDCYSDSGLQGELTAGYEMLRASTVRLFFEANAVLPFYNADATFYDSDTGDESTDHIYTPSITASVGLGFGRRNRGYR